MKDGTKMGKNLAKFHARRIGGDLYTRGMYAIPEYATKHAGWDEVAAVLGAGRAMACVIAGWHDAKAAKAKAEKAARAGRDVQS